MPTDNDFEAFLKGFYERHPEWNGPKPLIVTPPIKRDQKQMVYKDEEDEIEIEAGEYGFSSFEEE